MRTGTFSRLIIYFTGKVDCHAINSVAIIGPLKTFATKVQNKKNAVGLRSSWACFSDFDWFSFADRHSRSVKGPEQGFLPPYKTLTKVFKPVSGALSAVGVDILCAPAMIE